MPPRHSDPDSRFRSPSSGSRGNQPPAGEPQRESDSPFWQLWAKHRRYLTGLSMRWMSGNRADAEDAMSHAALKALAGYLDKASTIQDPRAWMTRLLYNVCIDLHRQRSTRTRVADQLETEGSRQSGFMARPPVSPEDRLMQRELLSLIFDRVNQLPPQLKETFEMRFVSEASYTEIAESLHTNNANIRKRIQLARGLLRDLLGR